MRCRERWIAATTMFAAAAAVSHAEQFRVQGTGTGIATQTFNSGQDVLIQIDPNSAQAGIQPFTDHRTIYIYDINAAPNVAPTASAGKVVIQGVPSGPTERCLDPRLTL